MRQLQEYFGLSRDECMAFGDNYNDIDMLNSVTYSYVMETAADDIKKHGKYSDRLGRRVFSVRF